MSISTIQTIAFRCKGCWQTTTAGTDQVGLTVHCVSCSGPVVVPEATDQRIKAGEEIASEKKVQAPPENPFREDMSVNEISQLIRKESLDSGSLDAHACSRMRRFLGAVIDGVAGLVAVVIGAILSYVVVGEPGISSLIVLCAVPLMFGFCQCIMIASDGRTVGKYCVKTKIVNLKGQPPGFFQGVGIRVFFISFLNSFPFFGLIDACWIFTNDANRCLHDLLAGTYVVDADLVFGDSSAVSEGVLEPAAEEATELLVDA